MKLRSMFSMIVVLLLVSLTVSAGTKKNKVAKDKSAKSTAACCAGSAKMQKTADGKDCPDMKDGKMSSASDSKSCPDMKNGKTTMMKTGNKMGCCAQHKSSEAKVDANSGKSTEEADKGEKDKQ